MGAYGIKPLAIVFGFVAALAATSNFSAAGDFGALAFNAQGAWGYSASYDTVDEAQDRALDECRKHGPRCNVARVFQNVCITVARNEVSGKAIFTWNTGYDKEDRGRRAVRNCRNDGGADCRILKEFCTGDARD